jgi:hypothetical protein
MSPFAISVVVELNNLGGGPLGGRRPIFNEWLSLHRAIITVIVKLIEL